MQHSGILIEAILGDTVALQILGDYIQERGHMPPYAVGTVWIFFMATRYIIGRVQTVTPFEIILEQASWVADTGRMCDALLSGNFNEIEPFPSGTSIINRFAINDATPCAFEPPTKQK